MTDTPQDAPPPPHVQVIQMASSLWVSRLLFVAAKLGLADLIAAGTTNAKALAAKTQSHERSMHRILRALGCIGILEQAENGTIKLTELGETLRSDHPAKVRSTVLMIAGPWMWQSFGEIEHSVATGKPAADKVFGMPIFDYIAKHPDQVSIFSEAMVGIHGQEPAAVAEAYDFSAFGTIVDVGGATGNLLGTILKNHPKPKGLLYDMPHVIVDAPAFLATLGVADRISTEGGSFFDRVPTGGDAYILSHIIHDWSEAQCLTILGHCRKAMKPGAKLLIVEMVLPEGNEPHPGKMLDLVMLTVPGGEERTSSEYGELLAKAGLRMTRVVPTASAVSVVEAEIA